MPLPETITGPPFDGSMPGGRGMVHQRGMMGLSELNHI